MSVQATGVGKTLAKLRKSGPDELKKSAEALVAKWKKAVDSDAAAISAPKRPRYVFRRDLANLQSTLDKREAL